MLEKIPEKDQLFLGPLKHGRYRQPVKSDMKITWSETNFFQCWEKLQTT